VRPAGGGSPDVRPAGGEPPDARPAAGQPPDARPAAPNPAGRRRWPFWAAVVVAAVGLAATAALTWASASDYSRNETRLIDLRARDVAAALSSVLPGIQTPLASASALANATGGSVAKFRTFIAPYVGSGAGRPFASVSLWRVGQGRRGPLAVAGAPPKLSRTGVDVEAFLRGAAASTSLSVVGLLRGPSPRLGYAFTGRGAAPFVAYGETALPPSRYAPSGRGSAFHDLQYAVYLGSSTDPAHLLIATVRHLPVRGRRATVRVPFGDTRLTVTIAARHSLAGSLPQRLPWAIAIGGFVLTLGATALTARLIDRRRATERLAVALEASAEENRRLYAEQWGITQTLQQALLPRLLPQFPGIQIGARYQAGGEGAEVGGDWYDVIELGDGRLLLVVGDVSGKGVAASTAMAALRFAIHAYAAQGDDPATFLPKLSRIVSVHQDRHLATVLCAVVDPPAREVTLTSAGHLPPLAIAPATGTPATTGTPVTGTRFLEAPVGLPVGIDPDAGYSSTTVRLPPGATLVVFTDGLVERRGETIEAGLERLRALVDAGLELSSPAIDKNPLTLDELLSRLLGELRQDGLDDTALAAIRWLS
jgi:hypothetical protein